MAVRALFHYSKLSGPHQSQAKALYRSLRSNLIKNIYNVYASQGYVYEQYDDETGKGLGSHPFTGWSSLVVLLMSFEET